MRIRRFIGTDAQELAALVRRNLLEVNTADYPAEEMEKLAADYGVEKIQTIASTAHMYVALDGGTIVGTGSIAPFWGSETESVILTFFVLPGCQGRGVGRKIMRALEEDEYFLRARRVEIPASITGCGFYEKMGYAYKNGLKELDEEKLYRMEKRRGESFI
jgi:GNAT superfamily N-acetyltransferase